MTTINYPIRPNTVTISSAFTSILPDAVREEATNRGQQIANYLTKILASDQSSPVSGLFIPLAQRVLSLLTKNNSK